jgi:hypothetical protein
MKKMTQKQFENVLNTNQRNVAHKAVLRCTTTAFALCAGLLISTAAFAQDLIFKSGFEANSILTLTNQFPDENAKIATGQHSTFGATFVRLIPGQAENGRRRV